MSVRATMGHDPSLLEPLRQRYTGWIGRLDDDGLPGVDARIVRLVADGLWAADLLGQQHATGAHPSTARGVRRVGDDHLWSTALVTAAISPDLAVLLVRLVHPTQTLVRTSVIAVLSYGIAFGLFYGGLGAGVSAAI